MNRSNVYISPARERPKLKPITAWRHMQQLIANKEDTEQVFHIIEALNGDSALKDFDRFLSTPEGRSRLKKRDYLPPILDNHEPLLALPKGSVGRTYVEFMEREGLSAAGLVAESERRSAAWREIDDDLLWYGNLLRDTHDMMHILTGYGRDALGDVRRGSRVPGLVDQLAADVPAEDHDASLRADRQRLQVHRLALGLSEGVVQHHVHVG